MRPNIDISHELNGRVKDWAEANNLGHSEAYSKLLERGLETDEPPDQQ